jgi:nucleoprotein TPR
LEDEIAKLRSQLSEIEKRYVMKCEEAASAIEAKEKEFNTLMNEIVILRNEVTQKV